MELELATQAREESEKRWEARWNTLPAHHEERLEIERQRLSEDQSGRLVSGCAESGRKKNSQRANGCAKRYATRLRLNADAPRKR